MRRSLKLGIGALLVAAACAFLEWKTAAFTQSFVNARGSGSHNIASLCDDKASSEVLCRKRTWLKFYAWKIDPYIDLGDIVAEMGNRVRYGLTIGKDQHYRCFPGGTSGALKYCHKTIRRGPGGSVSRKAEDFAKLSPQAIFLSIDGMPAYSSDALANHDKILFDFGLKKSGKSWVVEEETSFVVDKDDGTSDPARLGSFE